MPEDLLRQDFGRCAGRNDLAALHDDQLVAKHRRMVEVVQGNDAGDRQTGDEPHQADLVLDIEMVGRFV